MNLTETDEIKANLMQALNQFSSLNAVEELIKSKFKSDARLLNEIPTYLLELGGKRMRPALCMLTANCFSNPNNAKGLVEIAAGIELIHMATLLHDDIIDNASTRRKKESAYKKFGLANTLLAGDFLLTRAFSLCAHLDKFIIDATEEACIELTEGEILETPLFLEKHTVDSYLRVATKKTASLFRLASESAAHICGDDLGRKLFREFGETLGVAFQILDDILDVTASEDLLGKKTGSDLKEKKPSIINVIWLNSGSNMAKEILLNDAPLTEEQVILAIKEIRSGTVLTEAKTLANTYHQKAAEALMAISKLENINQKGIADISLLLAYTISRAF
jgi:octaprenyl-diphosphate synthase